MRARNKAAQIGEIETLRDQKTAIGLRRCPNARIIGTREAFSSNGIDFMTARREC